MKIKMTTMSIVIGAVIFGGVTITMAADIWTTTSTKVPVKYASGLSAGSYNPDDIRGSYTFADIEKYFEIDRQILYKAFGIDPATDATTFKSKNIEGMYTDLPVAIGNESIKVFVALYNNLPYTLAEEYLPTEAVELILEHNKAITQEQKTYLETHQVELRSETTAVVAPTTTPQVESTTTEESNIVKGSTTFQQVLDAGITKEQIIDILKDNMPPTNQVIRDYCNEKGISFTDIKDQINALKK